MIHNLCLSLFPGIDLLGMAFELEGYCVVRGPDVVFGGDIRTFHPPQGVFGIVFGGPPCQSFSSLAHLVRANGYEPKFGNLIPEFERCVLEAQPDAFVMENVRAAPEPVVPGYGTKSFLLDNSQLAAADGWGQEQIRVRRWTFGLRGKDAPDLRRWIDLAVFLLPDAEVAAISSPVGLNGDGCQHSQAGRERARELGRRAPPVTAGHHDGTDLPHNKVNHARTRRQAVLGSDRETPVKIGGSGKVKRTRQAAAFGDGRPTRQEVRSGEKAGKGRYRLADALRLQGLPEDALDHCPFTAEGKLKAVANGVCLHSGRAIAKAVKEAMRDIP